MEIVTLNRQLLRDLRARISSWSDTQVGQLSTLTQAPLCVLAPLCVCACVRRVEAPLQTEHRPRLHAQVIGDIFSEYAQFFLVYKPFYKRHEKRTLRLRHSVFHYHDAPRVCAHP